MAMLSSGHYDLVDKSCVRDKKSFYFVKFTDSAQRALNDFFKNPDKCKTPIIEFNKDDGRILIPTSSKGSVESDKCMAQFKFNVTSNLAMQGQQGRFECIQHKRGSKNLIKFGPLTHRLRIHANEDVFENTKNRMAAIELEQRKNCTREIEWNATSGINRKIRVDRSAKPAAPTPASAEKSNLKTAIISTKAATPLQNFENRWNKSLVTVKKPVKSTAKPRQNVALKTGNQALARRPLRQRLIHMLALRPHKKLELVNVLNRDGLKDSDSKNIMHTLGLVATMRDNTYYLLRHLWNDVEEDWPFYSEQERQLMKRQKPQNLTPPTSDSGVSVGSNQSPNNVYSGDKSPSCQYKRPGYINGVDGFQTKRHRISHYNAKRPTGGNEENVQISSSLITNEFDEVIEKSGLFNTAVKNPPIRNYQVNKSCGGKPPNLVVKSEENRVKSESTNIPHSDTYSSEKVNTSVIKDKQFPDDVEMKSHLSNNSFSAKNKFSSSITPLPEHSKMQLPNSNSAYKRIDYKLKYFTITSIEQRRRYKADYENLFKDYHEAQAAIIDVCTMFDKMGNELRKCDKDSPEYKIKEAEIREKYDAYQKNEKFWHKKKHFDYLQKFLYHIKELINEFDLKLQCSEI